MNASAACAESSSLIPFSTRKNGDFATQKSAVGGLRVELLLDVTVPEPDVARPSRTPAPVGCNSGSARRGAGDLARGDSCAGRGAGGRLGAARFGTARSAAARSGAASSAAARSEAAGSAAARSAAASSSATRSEAASSSAASSSAARVGSRTPQRAGAVAGSEAAESRGIAGAGAADGGVATYGVIQEGDLGRRRHSPAATARRAPPHRQGRVSSGPDRARPRTSMTPIAPTPAASTMRTTVDKSARPVVLRDDAHGLAPGALRAGGGACVGVGVTDRIERESPPTARSGSPLRWAAATGRCDGGEHQQREHRRSATSPRTTLIGS